MGNARSLVDGFVFCAGIAIALNPPAWAVSLPLYGFYGLITACVLVGGGDYWYQGPSNGNGIDGDLVKGIADAQNDTINTVAETPVTMQLTPEQINRLKKAGKQVRENIDDSSQALRRRYQANQ